MRKQIASVRRINVRSCASPLKQVAVAAEGKEARVKIILPESPIILLTSTETNTHTKAVHHDELLT